MSPSPKIELREHERVPRPCDGRLRILADQPSKHCKDRPVDGAAQKQLITCEIGSCDPENSHRDAV